MIQRYFLSKKKMILPLKAGPELSLIADIIHSRHPSRKAYITYQWQLLSHQPRVQGASMVSLVGIARLGPELPLRAVQIRGWP
jgi:hypothetical protein